MMGWVMDHRFLVCACCAVLCCVAAIIQHVDLGDTRRQIGYGTYFCACACNSGSAWFMEPKLNWRWRDGLFQESIGSVLFICLVLDSISDMKGSYSRTEASENIGIYYVDPNFAPNKIFHNSHLAS